MLLFSSSSDNGDTGDDCGEEVFAFGEFLLEFGFGELELSGLGDGRRGFF